MVALALGTAQFGSAYGVTNLSGRPDDREVRRILLTASQRGIGELDTAYLYDGSENALGRCEGAGRFRIITKTDKLGPDSDSAEVERIRRSFARSLQRLGRQSVDALLVHNADDLLGPAGAAFYAFLAECRERGLCRQIGVSVYEGAQIDACLERSYALDLVQLPLSVFDQRLVRSGHLAQLAELEIAIHVRSAFLQGLVLADPVRLTEDFQVLGGPLRTIRADAAQAGTTPMVIALGFLRAFPEVSRIVIGVTSEIELQQVCDAFEAAASVTVDAAQYAVTDTGLVDPRLWPRNAMAVRAMLIDDAATAPHRGC